VNVLAGAVAGDANSLVELRVDYLRRKEKPRSVLSYEVTNLDYTCSDGASGELAGTVFGPTKLKPVGTARPARTFEFDLTGKDSSLREFTISFGTVNGKATRATGDLQVDFLQPSVTPGLMAQCRSSVPAFWKARG